MDKVAILSDIHGNLHALDAVLADIDQRGITQIYCLGDLAGKGPDGSRVIDICREKCQIVVRGNWDSLLARDEERPDVEWWKEELSEEQRIYLGNLPNVHDFLLSGKLIRLYHASHISEYHRILDYAPSKTHKEMFTNTGFTGFENPEPDVVGYGDIHIAFMISPYDTQKVLFNVGSVGNPLDVPLSTYAILSGNMDSKTINHIKIDFIRLQYDVEGTILRAKRLNMTDYDLYEKELPTGIYRGRK